MRNKTLVSNKFKNTIYNLIFFYSLLIPFLSFYYFPYTYKPDFTSSNYFLIEGIFHYLILLLGLIITFKSLSGITYLSIEKKYLYHFFEAVLSIVMIVIACKEYDYITIINKVLSLNKINTGVLSDTINSNQLLPYSLIILFSTLLLLVIGIVNKNKFLITLSTFIIGFVLIKIFYSTQKHYGTGLIVLQIKINRLK
jgi:hypothetical protein